MEISNFIPPCQATLAVPRTKVTIGPKDHQQHGIKLHKKGDIVQAVEIRCSCGETIVIQCVYE
jgi:hypothetical protein